MTPSPVVHHRCKPQPRANPGWSDPTGVGYDATSDQKRALADANA